MIDVLCLNLDSLEQNFLPFGFSYILKTCPKSSPGQRSVHRVPMIMIRYLELERTLPQWCGLFNSDHHVRLFCISPDRHVHLLLSVLWNSCPDNRYEAPEKVEFNGNEVVFLALLISRSFSKIPLCWISRRDASTRVESSRRRNEGFNTCLRDFFSMQFFDWFSSYTIQLQILWGWSQSSDSQKVWLPSFCRGDKQCTTFELWRISVLMFAEALMPRNGSIAGTAQSVMCG